MEEIKNKSNNESSVIILILIILLAGAIIAAPLTHFKQETLICIPAEDICKVERTNHINIKTQKKLTKYSDIQEVSTLREKVKGNRYAKGYSAYLLTFLLKNNNNVVIFSNAYFDKQEINKTVQELNNIIKNSPEKIIFDRNP